MDETLFVNVTKTKNESIPWLFDINIEDSNWIITSSFMIFTMQTGKFSKFRVENGVFYFKNI